MPSRRPAAAGARRTSTPCRRGGTPRSAAARTRPATRPRVAGRKARSPPAASRRFRCTTRSLAPPLPWSETIATAVSGGAAASSAPRARSSAAYTRALAPANGLGAGRGERAVEAAHQDATGRLGRIGARHGERRNPAPGGREPRPERGHTPEAPVHEAHAVGARHALREVEDAVAARVHAGHERGPGRKGRGREGRAERAPR